jgi:yeast amino acid transporter
VPYTDPRLIENPGDANARASPFVIAIKNSGIPVLDSILNTVILITALSVGNTSVYASTRVLVALSVQHQAPKVLSYIDRKGRPQFALLVAFIFGLLSTLSQLCDNNVVFTWLLALSGLSSIITWGSICLAHIRFRKACDAQKLTERLPYKSPFGIWGSYIGLFINCGVIVGQFAQVILAVEWSHVSTSGQMELSWSYFFAIPLFALCYWAYVVYERWSGEMETMDLTTGTRFLRPGRRRHHVVKGAWWKNVYDVLCC